MATLHSPGASPDRPPTPTLPGIDITRLTPQQRADVERGMRWWNGLTEAARRRWLDTAWRRNQALAGRSGYALDDIPSAADAWAAHQALVRSEALRQWMPLCPGCHGPSCPRSRGTSPACTAIRLSPSAGGAP